MTSLGMEPLEPCKVMNHTGPPRQGGYDRQPDYTSGKRPPNISPNMPGCFPARFSIVTMKPTRENNSPK